MPTSVLRKNRIVIDRLIVPTALLLVTIAGFAAMYRLLCEIPGHGLEPPKQTFLDCAYFSVVTISSLGYGDIHPVGISRIVAAGEVIVGLLFIGVFVSRIVSVKQDEMLEYVMHARVIQTFDECLDLIRDAREELADESRKVDMGESIDPSRFALNRSNPFYSSRRALEILNGYINHTVLAKQTTGLDSRFDRAANHVEELSGVVKRFLRRLEHTNQHWKTSRTKTLVLDICKSLEEFRQESIPLTSYAHKLYKDSANLTQLLEKQVEDIRIQLANGAKPLPQDAGAPNKVLP